jgi:hypothetical protein
LNNSLEAATSLPGITVLRCVMGARADNVRVHDHLVATAVEAVAAALDDAHG